MESLDDTIRSYVPTVKDLLKLSEKEDISNLIQVENIVVKIEPFINDEQYVLYIKVPTSQYVEINRKYEIKNAEEIILDGFNEAAKGDFYIGSVSLKPDSNINRTLFQSGEYSGWKSGYYRVFISHLSSHRKDASRLKKALENYGITSFVAHEDINPTKEWIREIEKALNSMDCMVAMMYEGFHQSEWCDQEVGIALGRNITVIPLIYTIDPYGFIGEYQGIKFKGVSPATLANDIFQTLCDNVHDNSKYIQYISNLLLASKNKSDAKKWLGILEKPQNIDKSILDKIQSQANDNSILTSNHDILNDINDLLKRFGIDSIVIPSSKSTDDDELPF